MCGSPGSILFDPGLLSASLGRIPVDAWSLPSTYRATGVHHGYRRVVLVSAGAKQKYADFFDFVWTELEPVYEAWLSWIDPDGFIVPHRDAAPWRERWQVPIAASGQWVAGESFVPTAGIAFPVRHWEPHAVVNRDSAPRVHIVVDRDVFVALPKLGFETFAIPGHMMDLVERGRSQ